MKLDQITVDPARMNGQPCIRDLRITVRRVVELMAVYTDRDELRREFPELENEDTRQALVFATPSSSLRPMPAIGSPRWTSFWTKQPMRRLIGL